MSSPAANMLLDPLPALRETAGEESAILRVPDAPRVGDEVPVRGPEIDELAGLNCAGVAVEIVRPDLCSFPRRLPFSMM